MRGWHFESMRHSLAARGISTNPKYAHMGMAHRGSKEWWDTKKYWVWATNDFEEDEIDVDFELQVAERVRDNWKSMWRTKDIDLNYLKKSIDKESVDQAMKESDEVSMNIVFHKDPEYYGRGVGGRGSGKVFWLPYSYPDRDKIETTRFFGVDNARVLAHELSHGYGSHKEFSDSWNEVVAFKTLIEMGIQTDPVTDELWHNAMRVFDKERDKHYLTSFHMMRYLYRTFGEKVMSGYMLPALRYPEEVQRFNQIMREEISGKFGRGGMK